MPSGYEPLRYVRPDMASGTARSTRPLCAIAFLFVRALSCGSLGHVVFARCAVETERLNAMAADALEEACALRFDPTASQGHVESHFLKFTAPDGTRALWLKWTLLRPKAATSETLAEVWAIAFSKARCVVAAAKQTFPYSAVEWDEPFRYRIGESILRSTGARGRVSSEGRSDAPTIAWDLMYDSDDEPFWIYPRVLYTLPFPRSKTLTPHPSLTVRGTVDVDGVRWELDGWSGMMGHNWGRSHAELYAWIACNELDGADGTAWIESVSGRVKLGGLLLPWMNVAGLSLGGRRLRFDGWRALFARPTLQLRGATSADAGCRFSVLLGGGGRTLRIEAHAEPRAMAGLHYANPDGSTTHCLNSKLASGRFVLEERGRPPITLRSERVAFEIGTKQSDHGVENVL